MVFWLLIKGVGMGGSGNPIIIAPEGGECLRLLMNENTINLVMDDETEHFMTITLPMPELAITLPMEAC